MTPLVIVAISDFVITEFCHDFLDYRKRVGKFLPTNSAVVTEKGRSSRQSYSLYRPTMPEPRSCDE